MNNPTALNTVRFVVLILIQVLICNNILLLGYINPYPYIIFILLFSINVEQVQLLLLSFLLGLSIDFFENSGGANAAACVTLAFFRPFILQTCFGLNYIHQNLKLNNVEFKGLFLYVVLCTIIHHSVFFSLEVFDIYHIEYIVVQTLSSLLFTTIVTLISFSLFLNKPT